MSPGRSLGTSLGSPLGRPSGFQKVTAATPVQLFSFLAPGSVETTECAGTDVTAVTGQTITVARSTVGYCTRSDGVIVSIAANKPRIQFVPATVQLAILIEAGAVNLCTRSNDFTQAIWVKTNCTAAKTATGPDAVVNSASTLTATAGNGTALQTISTSTSTRSFSIYMKRRTGVGEIELTVNGGTTWTPVTASVGASWYRITPVDYPILVSVRTGTYVVGLRIVTSGDAIDVSFATEEGGAMTTSPFESAGSAGSRTADVVTCANPLLATNPQIWSSGCSMYCYPNTNAGPGSSLRTTIATGVAAALNTFQAFVGVTNSFSVYDAAAVLKRNSLTSATPNARWNTTAYNGSLNMYRDGVGSDTPTGSGAGVIATQNASLTIGSRGSGTQLFSNALLYNIQVYSGLTTAI